MKQSATKSDLITLDEFIIDSQRQFPHATGDLSQLLRDITLACRIIARRADESGLNDIRNQQKMIGYNRLAELQEFAVDQFRLALDRSGIVRFMAMSFSDQHMRLNTDGGKYIVVLHPIEGIPNMAYNASASSVFGIYRYNPEIEDGEKQVLRSADELVASGYVLYGSSVMLVFTTVGLGVHFFTLDDDVGEFFLAGKDIKVPEKSNYFSCNTGYEYAMDEANQQVLRYLRNESGEGEEYKYRYIGSLSADIHRIILEGGIFIYPPNSILKNGKLATLYECGPIALIMEHAGGIATDGQQRIMNKIPVEIHDKTPFYAGSPDNMKKIEAILDSKNS